MSTWCRSSMQQRNRSRLARRSPLSKLLLALLLVLPAAAQRVTVGEPKLEASDVAAGEGPSWDPHGFLYFVGQDRISKWKPGGKAEVFRQPAGGANGTLIDKQGRLVVCEASARRVTRTEPDGTITVLADNYEGKKFNSPNDLAADSKGRIYFTDPRYGK